MTAIDLGRYAVDTAYTSFLWYLGFRVLRGFVKLGAQELGR